LSLLFFFFSLPMQTRGSDSPNRTDRSCASRPRWSCLRRAQVPSSPRASSLCPARHRQLCFRLLFPPPPPPGCPPPPLHTQPAWVPCAITTSSTTTTTTTTTSSSSSRNRRPRLLLHAALDLLWEFPLLPLPLPQPKAPQPMMTHQGREAAPTTPCSTTACSTAAAPPAAAAATVPSTRRCPRPSTSPHAGEASTSFPHPVCRHKLPT